MIHVLIVLLLNFFSLFSNCITIPLKFAEEIPTLEVDIQGEAHTLILDLAFDCEVGLKKSTLKNLGEKERIGTYTRMCLSGEMTTYPTYLLQRIRLKNGEIIHTIVQEDHTNFPDHISGRLGRNLLQKSHVLIDFSKSLFMIFKNFEEFKKTYSMKHFQLIPFEMSRWGAIFTIETDFGFKKFFINTCAFSSMRNPDKGKNQKIATDKFKIGSVELGKVHLDIAEISPIFDDIDGYLGIDFFKNHAVFFDYQNKQAWIQLRK